MDNVREFQSRTDGGRWVVLGVMMTGTFVVALDGTVLGLALPRIMIDFESDIASVGWVLTGAMLAFALVMLVSPIVAQRYGYKYTYMGCLVVFTAGSTLCGLAPDINILILSRIIVGLGTGGMTPIAMKIFADTFSPRERAQTLGIWGISGVISMVVGLTFGGWIIDTFGWRAIFIINLPIGSAGVLLTWFYFKTNDVKQHTGFNILGFLLIGICLITLLTGISQGQKHGWDSIVITVLFGISIATFIPFMYQDSKSPNRIVDISLFKYRNYSVLQITMFVWVISVTGGMFLFNIFLQNVMGLSPLNAGIALLPAICINGIVGPFAGRLSTRIGEKWITAVGFAFMSYSFLRVSTMGPGTSSQFIFLTLIIRGFGAGLMGAPTGSISISSVPRDKVSSSTALINSIGQIAGTFSITIFAMLHASRLLYHTASVTTVLSDSPILQYQISSLTRELIEKGVLPYAASGKATAMIIASQKTNLIVNSYRDCFLVAAIFCLIAIIPLMFIKKEAQVES